MGKDEWLSLNKIFTSNISLINLLCTNTHLRFTMLHKRVKTYSDKKCTYQSPMVSEREMNEDKMREMMMTA